MNPSKKRQKKDQISLKAPHMLIRFIEFNKRKGVQIIYCILTLLISISTILYLNHKIPLIGDDFVYSFIYLSTDRVTSLSDILISQQIHYQVWGGRSIVHFIDQALLLINNPLTIDILNSIAFVGLILCMQLHITGRLKFSIKLYTLLYTLMWLTQPAFAETTLWITGSANYLWGTLIILTYILPYRLYKNKQVPTIKSILSAILMFLIGIAAGWTNENTAAAMIVIIALFLYYYKRNNWIIKPWTYCGLIGATIGYIAMIIAPGNLARAEGTSNSLFMAVYRLLTHTQTFVDYLGVVNLGTIILYILYNRFAKKKKRTTLHLAFIYLIGVFISIYIMVMSPSFPARAWFGTIVLNIIVLGIFFHNLKAKEQFVYNIKNSIVAFCVISFSFAFYEACKDVNEIDKIWKDRMIAIETSKSNGDSIIVFDEYQAKTKYGLGDARYALKYMSQYYDIEIQLENN